MLPISLSLVSSKYAIRPAILPQLYKRWHITSIDNTCHVFYSTYNNDSNQYKIPKVYTEAAKLLIPQLKPINPLLYEIKDSPVLEFFLQAKEKYPNSLILCRIGTFYEAFGLDAILLIEHAGLAPVGNKPKAGLPRSRLQETLNKMTKLGYTLAIFEESSHIGGSGKNIRKRIFSQIVSPENPTYLPHLETLSKFDTHLENMPPVVAVSQSPNDGFSISLIFLGQRRLLHYTNLTIESAISMVNTSHANLVITQGSNLNVKKLIDRCNVTNTQVLHGTDAKSFHEAALSALKIRLGLTKPFQKIMKKIYDGQMFPLSHSTALQMGLIKQSNSQNLDIYHKLHEMILPKETPQYCCNLLKSFMLNPPPLDVCNAIRVVTKLLSARKESVQFVRPLAVERCHILLESGKANRTLFREIRNNLNTFLQYMKSFDPDLLANALKITAYETCNETRIPLLSSSARKCLNAIESVIECEEVPVEIPKTIPVLDSYFDSMETFRGIIKPRKIEEMYRLVDLHAYRLLLKIISDMAGHTLEIQIEDRITLSKEFDHEKEWVRFLISNLRTNGEMVYTKKQPQGLDNSKFIQLKNIYNRAVKGAKTTKLVEAANMDYLVSVRDAKEKVTELMVELSNSIIPFLPLLQTVSYFNLLIQTLTLHASHALASDWSLIKPVPRKQGDNNRVLYLESFNPFYTNSNGLTITLQGVALLSGLNMSGKSTICRSVLAIAILSNIGLYSPCGSKSIIPRFDSITATSTIAYDIPINGKSLHLQQLEDINSVISSATENSLIIADEPCKGSTSKSSAALIATFVERLSNMGTFGIISTHLLEEISSLTFKDDKIEYYVIRALNMGNKVCPRWYYQLMPGKEIHSGSLSTAELAGLDDSFLQRAREFEINLNGGVNIELNEDKSASKPLECTDKTHMINIITHVIKSILGSVDICMVESNEIPPPGFSRRPVLYALILPIFKGIDLINYGLYIGESGHIAARLKQHFKKGNGPFEPLNADIIQSIGLNCDNINVDWSGYTGLLVKLSTKYLAKKAESDTIKTIQATFPQITLLSIHDRSELSVVE